MLARLRAPLAALVLAAAVSACGSDVSTAPEQPAATLEELFEDLSLSSIADAAGELSGVPSLSIASNLSPSCTFAAASQSFVCPTQSFSGLTVTESYTLLSAAGAPQSAFDPATTAALRATARVTGTVTQPGTNLTVDAQQTLTLSGIRFGPRTLNGTSGSRIVGTFLEGNTLYPVDVTTTTTIANLVLPSSTAAQRWPVSGTLTAITRATMTGLPALDATVKLTFNGTSKVAVAMTMGGVGKSCTVDLVTDASTCG
jgi:hypothetical protein